MKVNDFEGNKKSVALFIFSIFFSEIFLIQNANAETEIFEGIGFYELDVTKDTIANSKKQSKLFAERKALESAYVSIMSTSESVNGVTDIDEVIAETEGIMRILETKYFITPTDDNPDTFIIRAVVKAEIDLTELAERIKSAEKNNS